MLKVDKDKTATISSVQAAPITSSRPLPPLQPSTLHRTTDREDVHSMHAVEDQVFIDMGWTRQRDPKTDPDKATGVVPFRIPDDVIASVAKRTAGMTPSAEPITKETPEPARVAPATTTGAADATTPPPATAPSAAPLTAPTTGSITGPTTGPTTGGAQ